MCNLREIAHNVFYCVGVWASCTLLDAAVAAVFLRIRNRSHRRQERHIVHQAERKEG